MTKKKIATVVAVVLLVAALGGAAVYGLVRAEQYKRDLQYGYRRALNDLNDHVGNIETTLNKAVYANTATEQNGLAAKLMRESSMAKSSLSVLPVGDNSLNNVNKFIAQVGDFSMSLAERVSAGGKITAGEYKTMRDLESYSKKLVTGMQSVNLDFSDKATFHDSMQATAKDFTDFPSLIYDGPFSDNVTNQKPKLTQGKAQIPQGNAQNIAAGFLNTAQNKLTHTQDTAGNLPTYNFTANGGQMRISVTKAGGFVSDMADSRQPSAQKLDYAAASKKARAFLDGRGIRNMKESYYMIADNVCLINYAYVQDGVVCYPDLVKVGVALDNGGIVRFQAAGYIMNHTQRSLKARLTAQQAQKSVSPSLTVRQVRPALIPTPGKQEKLTYEFLCSGAQDDRVLVYINADTGYEEDILIIQQSDQGVLTK
ncbi:MAG: germination protein YpeB [Oscillospiraceae bacterium]|jgi:germination protein YpeB|nr:germination protein YpeB [Oscillospiraceae bacterium]MCI1990228.1 germination protein YpeB [Oscillospiraceae bacterium]MCI2036290.1 germination protein YpeB [Oscillospiraceae bacterium]